MLNFTGTQVNYGSGLTVSKWSNIYLYSPPVSFILAIHARHKGMLVSSHSQTKDMPGRIASTVGRCMRLWKVSETKEMPGRIASTVDRGQVTALQLVLFLNSKKVPNFFFLH